jgi:hypothetical protein
MGQSDVGTCAGGGGDSVTGATATKTEAARRLRIKLDVLAPAEGRDLANALLQAAWSAALEETRIFLVDLLVDWTMQSWEMGRDGRYR